MAPTYTTIANPSNPDVIPGVIFDWGTSKIQIPATVDSINAQQLYDTAASQAQDGSNGSPGQAYPTIVEAGGKIQIGLDATTGNPKRTGVITNLLGSWRIVTLKTSGSFTVTDIYVKNSAAEPFDRVTTVAFTWEKNINSALQTVSTGSGLSPAQDAYLQALYATLQASGVFSSAALANSPVGAGGFTNTDRTNLTSIKTKTDQLNFTSGRINAEVIHIDTTAIAQMIAAVDSSTKISRMSRELGSEIGVTATVLDAQDGVPGYLRTSAGDRKVITKNPDGSVTIALDT